MMDRLHDVLRSIRPETKSRDHLSVFREFLAHLGALQRQAPHGKSPMQRKARRKA
jgi:hypothetical protein